MIRAYGLVGIEVEVVEVGEIEAVHLVDDVCSHIWLSFRVWSTSA